MNNLNSNQKKLLYSLINDEKKINNNYYKSGPYWNNKNKKAIYNLNKLGLTNFRGFFSGVATGYSDSIPVDIRNEFLTKGRLASIFTKLPILKKIYDLQLKQTEIFIKKYISRNATLYKENQRVKYLISNYNLENTLEFGCELKFEYQNNYYSCHYLDLCDRIDLINEIFDLNKVITYFEIGGGFGTNIHLLLNNFKNIRKILYLDIVPNLFVGIEYLRNFYKESVKDYNDLKNYNKISFNKNDDLEILCIAPWQIENVEVKIDHFHNAASFQEMTPKIVKNYAKFIEKFIKNDGSLSLISYDKWKKGFSFNPKNINNFFSRPCETK